MPVYNVAAFLEECIDSVLKQSFADFELITVNDGSKDGSLALLEAYAAKDSRVRVLSQENGGYGKAMNAGLAVAQGEYIAVVESDDFIAENMFERLITTAKEHNADAVKARCAYFWDRENGQRVFGDMDAYPEEMTNRPIYPIEEKTAYSLPLYICTGIYRHAWLKQHEIRFHETPGASYQDTGFWFQTLSFAKCIVWITDVLHFYRQTNPNSSINKASNYQTLYNEYEYIQKTMQEKAPDLWPELEPAFANDFFRGMYFDSTRLSDAVKVPFLKLVRPRIKAYVKKGFIAPPKEINSKKDLFLRCLLSIPLPVSRALVACLNLADKYYFRTKGKIRSMRKG